MAFMDRGEMGVGGKRGGVERGGISRREEKGIMVLYFNGTIGKNKRGLINIKHFIFYLRIYVTVATGIVLTSA